ncbi:hypothetical protein JD844_017371 [Phrynosoma platyrhinos]|uniref:PIN domain-containing protein n=1 Tax=Phrynosoma platyrhinos TaxID=52577 RepID=A0ABQ7SLY7_PHRPL|nr:hypothetical protein JD844_017371 [Phrynosoma platyrhinos]
MAAGDAETLRELPSPHKEEEEEEDELGFEKCTAESSETSCHSFSAPEATENTDADQEMRIVEDLHAARLDQKMALPVVQTCGELTSMDIDLPDDESNNFAKSVAGLNTVIVVDTNIMIRHLEFIKSLKNSDIPGIGSFVLVIPWVVLQELDNLKRGKILANVGQKAIPAVHFIYKCLKSQDQKLWGQSMQLASQKTHDFIVENNDDRVLQCCLQYRNLFPEVEVVLLTDDKNLCNKALVSEIKACSKVDLVTALRKLVPKNVVINQDASIGQSLLGKDTSCHEAEDSSTDPLSVIILDTKKCLGEVLSSILETELKIVYGDLWTEVIILYARKLGQFTSCLLYFHQFQLGTEQNSSGVLKSTSGETACEKMEDVALIQNTQTGDKLLSPKPLAEGNRYMEIWSVLQTLWDRMNGFSLEVFQKLDLSAVTTTENMASFKEAFTDLQKLMSGVNEILSGIQKVLVPNSTFQDTWTLYNFLTNAEVNNDTKFTAEELYECISQEVYRDRLSIGCGQLAQLEHTIKQRYESVCLEIKNRGWL